MLQFAKNSSRKDAAIRENDAFYCQQFACKKAKRSARYFLIGNSVPKINIGFRPRWTVHGGGRNFILKNSRTLSTKLRPPSPGKEFFHFFKLKRTSFPSRLGTTLTYEQIDRLVHSSK